MRPFIYDYIVDANWDGLEGQEFGNPAFTFKVFSTIQAAIDDAEDGDTFFVVSGTYTR